MGGCRFRDGQLVEEGSIVDDRGTQLQIGGECPEESLILRTLLLLGRVLVQPAPPRAWAFAAGRQERCIESGFVLKP